MSYEKDDRAVVLFHYRDKYGRRLRDGRWLTRIGPWPIELGHGVKTTGRWFNDAKMELYEVAAIGWEGFHLVVDLRPLRRSPGARRGFICVTSWPELEVGTNIVNKDEPWLSREPQ